MIQMTKLGTYGQQTGKVPKSKVLRLKHIIFFFSLTLSLSNCETPTSMVRDSMNELHQQSIFRYVEATTEYSGGDDLLKSNSRIPTPPLDSDFAVPLNDCVRTQGSRAIEGFKFEKQAAEIDQISPTRVFRNLVDTNQKYDAYLFSPIVRSLQSDFPDISIYSNLMTQNSNDSSSWDKVETHTDTSNAGDMIESGSGMGGWDSNSFEDSSNILEDSTTSTESGGTESISPTLVQPTPVLTPEIPFSTTASLGDGYDRPPILQRRLPKLVATAGQAWKFYIPPETFMDEDGDLRQLKSNVVQTVPSVTSSKIDSPHRKNRDSICQFNSWLQYDQSNQLLYGFPTEEEVGVHEYLLVVGDKWGMINNESIEIHVRRHQSSRAFTHLIVMNRIEWNWQKYSSLVDGIGEFVRRVTTQAFGGQPFRNFIAQYYSIDSSQNNDTNSNEVRNNCIAYTPGQQASSSFTIAWSDSSVPVHPCNLSYIDHLSQVLMDTQKRLPAGPDEPATFEPSRNLMQALDNEFRPTSISIFLQGACENRDSLQSNRAQDENTEGPIRTRTKIGKLKYKLGEPVEYRIPAETFELGKISITRDLMLSVHSIDGMSLDAVPRYSFLEFDQDSQTLYGLSYDFNNHVGQHEIQLTGRHPKSGHKVREVFIIDIEAQDLTAINNRAFRMSLYVGTRTGLFGPRMRVELSHRISEALHFGENGYRNAQEKPEFTVVDIQKFAFGSQFDNRGADIYAKSNQGNGITRVLDNSSYLPDDLLRTQDSFTDHTTYGRTNYLYKYIWTDSTIGHRGDCPVEVIKESILYALERSMLEHNFSAGIFVEDSSKNDSVKFYNRLRRYFEPELDLIHLRFEPTDACIEALEQHDVGNSDLADQVDKAGDVSADFDPVPSTVSTPSPAHESKVANEINNDEYLSIVVLIVLVVALIFVILMFVMGMHTYRINQDKRFELQVRLAQARQNSMYLSSMILADHANAHSISNGMMQHPVAKSMYVIQDEDKVARRPVILDNEKQILVGRDPKNNLAFDRQKPSVVRIDSGTIQTSTMRPNMTFTLDSIASWQQHQPAVAPGHNQHPMMQALPSERQRSMTLHRPPSVLNEACNNGLLVNRGLNHSQSILTVAGQYP